MDLAPLACGDSFARLTQNVMELKRMSIGGHDFSGGQFDDMQ